jgi:hypothetical protein
MRHRVIALLLALGLCTTLLPHAWARVLLAPTGVLKDGTKFATEGDKLFLLDRAGKKIPAKNGIHVTRDGKQFVVQNGRVTRFGPLGKEPPRVAVGTAKPGTIGQSDDIPEKTESYYVEVDPSEEYGDDKSKLGTSPGVKGKILTPSQKPATP